MPRKTSVRSNGLEGAITRTRDPRCSGAGITLRMPRNPNAFFGGSGDARPARRLGKARRRLRWRRGAARLPRAMESRNALARLADVAGHAMPLAARLRAAAHRA